MDNHIEPVAVDAQAHAYIGLEVITYTTAFRQPLSLEVPLRHALDEMERFEAAIIT